MGENPPFFYIDSDWSPANRLHLAWKAKHMGKSAIYIDSDWPPANRLHLAKKAKHVGKIRHLYGFWLATGKSSPFWLKPTKMGEIRHAYR
jgi:hypothetical protein